MEIVNIKDPTQAVILFVQMRTAGQPFGIKCTAMLAREFLVQWKKTMIYYSQDPAMRGDEEKPFFIYHFLDGDSLSDEPMHACASFLLTEVIAAHYVPITEATEVKI